MHDWGGDQVFPFASHSTGLAPPLTPNLEEDYAPNVFTCLSSHPSHSYKCGLGDVFEAILLTSMKSSHAGTLDDWFLVRRAQDFLIFPLKCFESRWSVKKNLPDLIVQQYYRYTIGCHILIYISSYCPHTKSNLVPSRLGSWQQQVATEWWPWSFIQPPQGLSAYWSLIGHTCIKKKTQKYTPVKTHIEAHLAPKKMLLDRSLVADILARWLLSPDLLLGFFGPFLFPQQCLKDH